MLSKWILYTIICGAIPIFARIAISLATNVENFSTLSAGDLIAYGIVLHISLLNALESSQLKEGLWITITNVITIFGLTYYAILFTIFTIPNISADSILFLSIYSILCSILLAVIVQIRIVKGTSKGVLDVR